MAPKTRPHGIAAVAAAGAAPGRRVYHPLPAVTDEVDRFDEAIHAFRQRIPMLRDEWDALAEDERIHAFTVSNVTQADLVTDVWEAIDRALTNGTDFDRFKAEVGDKLAEAWGGEDSPRLDTVFRTNVLSSYNEGRYAVFSAPAVKEAREFMRFDAVIDDRTDDECESLNGITLPQDDPFWDSNVPPLHFQCFLPGTVVEGRFIGGLRARYSGKAIEIVTAGGRRLRVTPDHPIMTPSGFVPAKRLGKGDQVVTRCRDVHVPTPGSGGPNDEAFYEHDDPATVDEVFDLLRESGPSLARRIPRLNLYGDPLIVEGDVEVVGSYAALLTHGEARAQRGGKVVLEDSLPEPKSLAGRSSSDLPRHAGLGATDGSMGFKQGSGSPDGIRSVRRQPVGFGLAPDLNTNVDQVSHDRIEVDSSITGDRVDRLTGEVALGDDVHTGEPKPSGGSGGDLVSNRDASSAELTHEGMLRDPDLGRKTLGGFPGDVACDDRRQVVDRLPVREPLCLGRSSQLDASLYEDALDGSPGDANLARDLLKRFPASIALDQIADVVWFDFDGHVFDFETDIGWMLSQSIVSSNCRCTFTAVSRTEADDAGGPDDEGPDTDHADDGFGQRPGAPGENWQPDVDDYPDAIAAVLKEKLAG